MSTPISSFRPRHWYWMALFPLAARLKVWGKTRLQVACHYFKSFTIMQLKKVAIDVFWSSITWLEAPQNSSFSRCLGFQILFQIRITVLSTSRKSWRKLITAQWKHDSAFQILYYFVIYNIKWNILKPKLILKEEIETFSLEMSKRDVPTLLEHPSTTYSFLNDIFSETDTSLQSDLILTGLHFPLESCSFRGFPTSSTRNRCHRIATTFPLPNR